MTAPTRGFAMDRRVAIAGVVLAPALLVAGLVIGTAPSTVEALIPLAAPRIPA
jgi:hypothetical protein